MTYWWPTSNIRPGYLLSTIFYHQFFLPRWQQSTRPTSWRSRTVCSWRRRAGSLRTTPTSNTTTWSSTTAACSLWPSEWSIAKVGCCAVCWEFDPPFPSPGAVKKPRIMAKQGEVYIQQWVILRWNEMVTITIFIWPAIGCVGQIKKIQAWMNLDL